MKALSIKQPWAFLIVHGFTEHLPDKTVKHLKDIENRTWNTKFRGRFLIHASKQPDKKALKYFINKGINPEDLVYGAIIGSVELVDVVTKSESQWFQGPYGFVLKNQKCMLDPKPLKGKLGFFETKEDEV